MMLSMPWPGSHRGVGLAGGGGAAGAIPLPSLLNGVTRAE